MTRITLPTRNGRRQGVNQFPLAALPSADLLLKNALVLGSALLSLALLASLLTH